MEADFWNLIDFVSYVLWLVTAVVVLVILKDGIVVATKNRELFNELMSDSNWRKDAIQILAEIKQDIDHNGTSIIISRSELSQRINNLFVDKEDDQDDTGGKEVTSV